MAATSRTIRALVAVAALSLVVAACTATDGDVDGDASSSDDVAADDAGTLEDSLAAVFAGSSTLDGAAFDGGELAQGNVVLWFWAPWCTSCRAEGPRVAEVAEAYSDQVRIVGVPGRGQVPAMSQFVDDTGTGALEHVIDDDGSIWTAFEVYGQPAFAFLDENGRIEVFVGTLGSALEDRVAELAST